MKIVQCWDDGVINDIRLTELLRKYNAKATFNLNPGLMTEERQPSRWCGPEECANAGHFGYVPGKVGIREIKEIYDGFELASHTWKHENPQDVSTDEFVKSALDARKFIEDIWQRECRGFAWPFGVCTDATVQNLQEAGFAYGRLVDNSDDPSVFVNPLMLKPNCHVLDRRFFVKYNKAKADGCKFFYFWGHSYEFMEYDSLWKQFEYKLQMIAADPDAEWANVIDIVR